MAKLVKCPKCATQFDASSVPPGSTVPCTGCGTLTRIPTGTSSAQHPSAAAAPAPAAAPAKPGSGKKGTKVRHRGGRGGQKGRKKSNAGLVVGLSLGGLALVIVVVAVAANSSSPPAPPSQKKTVAVPAPPTPPPAPAAPASPTSTTADTGEAPKPKPAPRNPDRADWPKLMRMLRPGGGFDAMDRPEGQAFAIVKGMGKGAYPHLVKYIGDEDITLARAAVAVLNELTGRNSKLPNETTRPQIKSDWETWLADNK